MALLNLIPPGLIVAVLAILILSQVFYAALPYRKRAYVPILVTTAAGFVLGQLWDRGVSIPVPRPPLLAFRKT